MTKQELKNEICRLVTEDPAGLISAKDAIYPELAGMRLYDEPLVGFAAADDPLFTVEFKKKGVVHPDYLAPEEWLPGARTVVSYFLPFTQEVRESNRGRVDEPYEPGLPQRCSALWLHGRIEGQAFMGHISEKLRQFMLSAGCGCVCPAISENFRMLEPFVSNWSERHAAYAAGLGTFSLSKGLITEKGMAGRFGSFITTAEFEPDPRPYSQPFEYCIMCGACMARCPSGAIDATKGCIDGKDHGVCHSYVKDGWLPPHGPNRVVRYGCGKCQVAVPCERGIPGRK